MLSKKEKAALCLDGIEHRLRSRLLGAKLLYDLKISIILIGIIQTSSSVGVHFIDLAESKGRVICTPLTVLEFPGIS